MGKPLAIMVTAVALHTEGTNVTIVGTQWHVDGRVSYEGHPEVEGLLFNSRLIQGPTGLNGARYASHCHFVADYLGIFDDENETTREYWRYPDTKAWMLLAPTRGLMILVAKSLENGGLVWDPDRNTQEFVGNMSSWKSSGLMAFTVGMQGGSPHCYGNEQWVVSAFMPNGTVKTAWLGRLRRVLDKADELGMVPIVQFFYHTQFQNLLPGASEVAIQQATEWLLGTGLKGFVVEVFNEMCNDESAAMIQQVHNVSSAAGHRLLVSASCGGGGIPPASVVSEADFVLVHGNGQVYHTPRPRTLFCTAHYLFANHESAQSPDGISRMPIVFNEDDHGNFTAAGGNSNLMKSAYLRNRHMPRRCSCKLHGDSCAVAPRRVS
eukprot:gene3030-3586_t